MNSLIPKQLKMDAQTEQRLIELATQDDRSQSAQMRWLVNQEWLRRQLIQSESNPTVSLALHTEGAK